jgi:HK97 family phage prohead protease
MANEIERRVASATLSLRSAPKGVASPGILEGYAATFNSWSNDLGGFKEQIQPGAFDRALRQNQDVRCLVNHDPSLVLGRWKSGTLGLTTDARGLRFTCQLPDTTAGRDIHTLVKRGDLTQCSFAFRIAPNGDSWNRQRTERTLTDLDLMDVSAVTYPAYEDTSVSARSRNYINPAIIGRDFDDWATATPEAIRLRVRRLTERIQRDDSAFRTRNDSADVARFVREIQGR